MKYLFIILVLVSFCQGDNKLEGGKYLFDLDIDPLETTNVYDVSEYITMVTEIEDKTIDYWTTAVRDPDTPDSSDKITKWDLLGGVSPWIHNTTTRVIENNYNYEDAPHIVYILIDDWGYNDVGYRSSYLNWTTPTVDRLASEGVKLENYYTSNLCTPSRGALLTGRYPSRLGFSVAYDMAELPLDEVTLAEELKSAGYRTYMVGKWHLGMSSRARTPLYRGFDYFYGFLGGFIDYWNKTYENYLDLRDGDNLESNPEALSSDLHSAYLFESKAEAVIANHATEYPDQPMFLYMASQLIHETWAAPQVYLDRCIDGGASEDEYPYCGMNVMVDEAVANLTCVLEQYGMADNTVLIIASDNGGVSSMTGSSYPFRGNKGSFYRFVAARILDC